MEIVYLSILTVKKAFFTNIFIKYRLISTDKPLNPAKQPANSAILGLFRFFISENILKLILRIDMRSLYADESAA
jgi:hypothetical protein